jgi:hypothetical protein
MTLRGAGTAGSYARILDRVTGLREGLFEGVVVSWT